MVHFRAGMLKSGNFQNRNFLSGVLSGDFWTLLSKIYKLVYLLWLTLYYSIKGKQIKQTKTCALTNKIMDSQWIN